MTAEEIQKMKRHAEDVRTTYGVRDEQLFKRYREMFFMDDETKPKWSNVDANDIAVTVSPSARNEVVGMVRLLDTSNVHVAVTEKGETASSSDKIEQACKTVLRVSGEFRRARIESDAALSVVLFGPAVGYAESLKDLIEVNKADAYSRRQLEDIQKRTPFLLRVINAEQSYPEWGEWGIVGHEWIYKAKGSTLKQRWGVTDGGIKPEIEYTVHDIYNCENRLVYAEGITEPLFAKRHGLLTIPIVVRYAGGSSLFEKPEQQLQSFLYSKAKSRLDKRESAILTAVATAVNTRGLIGPLLGVDPENIQPDQKIVIQTIPGGGRAIIGKVTNIDDKIIDPVIFQWREWLRDLSGQSTIFGQTLGENISSQTFSGLAMLSSAGKLPLVDAQRAIETMFRDLFVGMLRRIKDEGIENNLINPQDIPDDFELEVTLDPDLPQDQLRNAQIAQSLGDLVSDEWKHSNLLKIPDSKEMAKQTTKETLRKALVQAIVSDQEAMNRLKMSVLGMSPQPSPEAGAASGGMTSPLPAEQPSPQPSPLMGEGVGQTDAMIPPQERR
jgi:hypothetical protein